MGDRANIKIIVQADKPALFLYSHCYGSGLAARLQHAMRHADGRRGDWSYYLRVIIDQVTAPGRDALTGWGLSFEPCDNSHRLLVLDFERQIVRACAFDWEAETYEGAAVAECSFDAFLCLAHPNDWRDQ